MPLSTMTPSFISCLFHMKPHVEAPFFESRTSSISTVLQLRVARAATLRAARRATLPKYARTCSWSCTLTKARSTTASSSTRACSAAPAAVLPQAPCKRLAGGLGAVEVGAGTGPLPEVWLGLCFPLVPFREAALPLGLASGPAESSPSPSSSPGGGGELEAVDWLTPRGPPKRSGMGRSSERSKKGSSRTEMRPQPQQSTAAQRWPRKLAQTQLSQTPEGSAPLVATGRPESDDLAFRSANVGSSEIDPITVRKNSCASCCWPPRYQGNFDVS
mmetsp:Transcript_39900/g.87089  ORF Transcript_39900/g.87089 Transcript_39900/m.87089 type:complete len:274 (-) Transcript_39900:381-1202(-)